MVMGGNDGFNVIVDGQLVRPVHPGVGDRVRAPHRGGDARAAAAGRRPVYWAPSPTARDEEFNRIYRVQNFAVERAAPAVPGARYVDLYTTIDNGRYRDDHEDRRPAR